MVSPALSAPIPLAAPHPAPLPEAGSVPAMLDAAEPLSMAHALVIGPDSLEVLCGLISRGCGAATELAPGGRLPAERAEIVLVPHVGSLSEASQAITLARRTLLPCGRIVLHDADGRLAAHIARMLRSAGFSAVRVRSRQDGAILTADWPMFGLQQALRTEMSHG